MMKKMSLLLALCMTAALTACGKPAETKPAENPTTAAAAKSGKEADSTAADTQAAETDYPKKSVQFIVPYSAGGGTDSLMRLLTAAMEKDWGQPLVVSNKGGGLGQVGLTELAAAKPDGYTIGALSNLDHVLVLLTGENVSYNYDSFEYLGAINTTANVLMAGKDSGFKSMEDLVAYAKENPGKVTVSISGKTHIAELGLFEQAAGIKLTTVMQESGSDSLNAILGGHVDCAVLDKKFVAQVEGQGIETLATFAGERVPVIPDIPTLKELGYDVATETYRVIVAPKGTPQEIKDKITATMKKVTDEEFQKSMTDMSELYRFLDQDEVKARLDQDYKAMESLVAENPDLFK